MERIWWIWPSVSSGYTRRGILGSALIRGELDGRAPSEMGRPAWPGWIHTKEKLPSWEFASAFNKREDQGTWGLTREDVREFARNHPQGRP
jgi:hypothetical protein